MIVGTVGDRTIRVLLCELLKLRIIAVKRLGGLLDFAVPSKNQTGLVQRIPPEHTAHGVGDEGDDLVSHGTDVVAALHGFWHIVLAVEHAMHGHILVRHIRRQFVLQAVNVNENAVKFFFVLFELLEAVFTLLLPCSIGSGQSRAIHQRILFEIPRSFIRIPISPRKENALIYCFVNGFFEIVVNYNGYGFNVTNLVIKSW